MRSTVNSLFLAGLAATAVALVPVWASDIEPQAADALQHFLHLDCEVGEEGQALNRLLEFAGEVEPELERLLVEGPDATARGATLEALERQWNRREKFLESDPDLGLDSQHLAAALSVTREEYLQRGLGRFVDRCRERAVIGLAAIGSDHAVDVLRRTETGAVEPLARLIRSSLRRFGVGTREDTKPARKRGSRR